MTERPVETPPLVTVMAILLYVGGGLTIVSGLLDLGGPSGVTGLLPGWGVALYGALYVGLARALQLGRRWARRIALGMCWIGLALAMLYAFGRGPQEGAAQAVWPVVYLVLLTRPSVRAWYAPA